MEQSATPMQHVAAVMKKAAAAAPNRHAFQVLKRGLAVVYGCRDGRYRLAIGRQAPASPSQQEMEILATAFAAPFDFDPTHRQASWWDEIEHCKRTFNVLEITWREVPLATLAAERVPAGREAQPVEVQHAH